MSTSRGVVCCASACSAITLVLHIFCSTRVLLQRYMAEISLQRDLKQQLFEAQKAAEFADVAAAKDKELFRAQVIEAARRQLLREHAAVLVRGQAMSPLARSHHAPLCVCFPCVLLYWCFDAAARRCGAPGRYPLPGRR